jgi:hypothetical protein
MPFLSFPCCHYVIFMVIKQVYLTPGIGGKILLEKALRPYLDE